MYVFLDEQDKDNILKLFYRKKLRRNEFIIDNADSSIAKELDIPKSTITNFIAKHLTDKYEKLNKKINAK